MNYKKKGLNQLLEMILRRKVRRLVLTHKDRLLRFGSELIFALCELQNIEVVLINKGEQPTFEEELAKDVIEIITVFSARLYGSRSNKNKKLLEAMERGEEVFVTKAMTPSDVEDPQIRQVLQAMNTLQLQAFGLIAGVDTETD